MPNTACRTVPELHGQITHINVLLDTVEGPWSVLAKHQAHRLVGELANDLARNRNLDAKDADRHTATAMDIQYMLLKEAGNVRVARNCQNRLETMAEQLLTRQQLSEYAD